MLESADHDSKQTIAAPVGEGLVPTRLHRSRSPQPAILFRSQYFVSGYRQLQESWCEERHGVQQFLEGWLELPQCSKLPAAAGSPGRYINRFPSQTGSRTTSVPGQRTVERVVAANDAATEVLRFLSNFQGGRPAQQWLGFQTLPGVASPHETLLGFETLLELPAMSGHPVQKNFPPPPLVRRA